MNSHCYDAVCGLSLGNSTDAGKQQKFKSGVQAVMASSRLDAQVYGRRWNDLTPEGQNRIIIEKRQKRVDERVKRDLEDQDRVTMAQVEDTMRRNSMSGTDMLKHRLSRKSTDLTNIEGELVWGKAWLLSIDASSPDFTSGAKYHNRRRDSGYVPQSTLNTLGVVYMKLSVSDLDKLNELCSDRGYSSMENDSLTIDSQQMMQECYREQYNTTEYIVFVEAGACFVDVRDENHEFIRIDLQEGDLLIIPPGLFHRFALGQGGTVSMLKCYMGTSEVVHRETAQTQHESRAQYLASRKRGSVLEDNMFIVE